MAAGADGRIMKWNVSSESELESVNLDSRPIQVEWCPQDSALLAVISASGKVFLWNSSPAMAADSSSYLNKHDRPVSRPHLRILFFISHD